MDNQTNNSTNLRINSRILNELKFDINGLIPAIAQDNKTNEVLMLAYMNKESIEKTLSTGKAHYWSRSRNKIWQKGETSGHFQYVEEITIDCDGDAILLKVVQEGNACHTGNKSCFYRFIANSEKINGDKRICNAEVINEKKGEIVESPESIGHINLNSKAEPEILGELYKVIADRKNNPKEGSYTNYLFEKGLDKILKKIGEEASEVIIAAKNNSFNELKYEISDLVYHVIVLMVEQELKLDDIYEELKGRRKG